MKRLLLALSLIIAAFVGTSQPASATECTPKGCTGGCHVNPRAISIDEGGTITLGQPIVCYS